MHYNIFIQIFAHLLLLYYNSIKILKKSNKNNKDFDLMAINYLHFFHQESTKIFSQYHTKIKFKHTKKILFLLIDHHYQIKKIFDTISHKLNMSGGFFYGEYDSVYTKILNILDIIIDFMSIVPTNNIFQPEIIAPLQIFSTVSNAMRGDFILAFYSFLTLIPGVGNIVGAGSKIIYKLINYIIEKIQSKKQIKRLEDLEVGKSIYTFTNYDPTINYIQESLESIDNEDLLIGN